MRDAKITKTVLFLRRVIELCTRRHGTKCRADFVVACRAPASRASQITADKSRHRRLGTPHKYIARLIEPVVLRYNPLDLLRLLYIDPFCLEATTTPNLVL